MKQVVKISNFITKYFVLIIIGVCLFAYFVPKPGIAISATKIGGLSAVSILLMIIIFGMGVTLSIDNFKEIAQNPKMVILGTVAHYVIMPLVAFVLVHLFGLTGAAAAGVILVGSAPSGTASNVMSFLAGGDVALDVSIGLLSTLLAPIMMPSLLKLLAGKWVAVPFMKMFLSALEIVIIPIILGLIVHTLLRKYVDTIVKIMPLFSQVAILIIIASVFSANAKNILSATALILVPVVILHNLCGYALGYGFSRLLKLKLPQQKAITFEVGMQDSALASTLAISYFSPAAALPAVIFSVWHNISGSTLASLWRNKK